MAAGLANGRGASQLTLTQKVLSAIVLPCAVCSLVAPGVTVFAVVELIAWAGLAAEGWIHFIFHCVSAYVGRLVSARDEFKAEADCGDFGAGKMSRERRSASFSTASIEHFVFVAPDKQNGATAK